MRNIKLLLIIAIVLVASSCKKDEVDEPKFSALSVEDNKKNIEKAGYDIMDEMENMEDLEMIEVVEAFVSFAEESDPFEANEELYTSYENELGVSMLKSVSDYSNTGVKGIKNAMVAYDDDPETIQEMFDLLAGVYEWNSDYEEWNYSPKDGIIELKFPSTEYGRTNNASYIVTYEGVEISNSPIDEDYTGDFPKHVTYKLDVDEVTMSNCDAKFAYDNDGYPNSADITLDIESYQFKIASSNANNKKGSVEFSCKSGSSVIAMLKMQMNGNWTEENIEKNTRYYIDYWDGEEWIWVEEEVGKDDDYDYTETDYHKVIVNGNASVQLMNIKVTGNIDIEKLVDGMDEIDDRYDSEEYDYEDTLEEEADLLNRCMDLTLINVDRNEIMAKCEAYVAKYDGDGDYDYYQDYYTSMRFVFADGSKIDVETYFEDGFDDLLDDLDDYVEDLDDDYGY
jgi:hypothetical protein